MNESMPDSSNQTSTRGLLTGIYVSGTLPWEYLVHVSTRPNYQEPTWSPWRKAQEDGVSSKLGEAIVGLDFPYM